MFQARVIDRGVIVSAVYNIDFVGMFLLDMNSQSGSNTLCGGNFVISVTGINWRGEKFIESAATAEVSQPTTVYSFTSFTGQTCQDSQEPGTKMGLFYSSPVARVVCLR